MRSGQRQVSVFIILNRLERNGLAEDRKNKSTAMEYDRPGCLGKDPSVQSESRPFRCTSCGRRFVQKEGLSLHSRVHGKATTPQCKICGKTFSNKSYLPIHMRTHTGRKAFPARSAPGSSASTAP